MEDRGMSLRQEDGLLITAIGNPNLDITVLVEDTHFFVQHNIPLDGQTPVPTELMTTLEHDFKRRNYARMYFPGGCSQNTLRVFQWLMDSKFQSCMIGSVGNDEEALSLMDQLEKDGVKSCYSVVDNYRTSVVFIFVHKNSRSAVYCPNGRGAATIYSMSHLLEHSDALRSMKNSKIVLTEGFFTEHSAEVALKAIITCAENGIVTSFNICGPYVVERHFEKAVDPFLKTCNIVVGNLEEFNSLCDKLCVRDENTKTAAIAVHKIMMSNVSPVRYRVKSLDRYKKILIVTNGEKEVLCVTDSDGLVAYAVPPLECSKIKDTTGAGDAFLAGFLFGLLKEQSLLKCLKIACHVAGEVIQQYGTKLPEEKPVFLTTTS